jgi:hypothetical protein
MEKHQREIVLIDQSHKDRNQFLNKSLEGYFLDPVELFSKIDWRLFQEDVTVANTVYGELFEAVVLNHKKLICYWPHLNIPDNNWFELWSQCKDAKIKTRIIYSKNCSDQVHVLSSSIQETWKTFVRFLMESLCEDIKMNENLQEIAILKCGDDSILLFKLEQNGIRQYSYLQSPENGFDFDYGNVQFKENGANYTPFFSSFELLLEKLMLEIDVNSYQISFSDRALEKHYFNTLLKNCTSKNLIETWVKNYSLN